MAFTRLPTVLVGYLTIGKQRVDFHRTGTEHTEGGTVVIPTGTPVTGRVVEAKSAGRLSGAAALSIELASLKLPAPGG